MCNFESNPDQRSTGNEALSIRDPNAHRSRQTPSRVCRYSIRRYLPPLIGPKPSFSRRSLAGDAENKEEDCAEALTQDLRQHSNLLFRTVFRRLLVRNHKSRSTRLESPAVSVIPRHAFLIVPYLRIVLYHFHLSGVSYCSVDPFATQYIQKYMGAFSLLINTSDYRKEQRTLRACAALPFYPSLPMGKAFI